MYFSQSFLTYACILTAIIQYVRIRKSESGVTNSAAVMHFGAMYPEAVRRGQWYRLITGGFVHFSTSHLFMNGYALYVMGTNLEPLLGHGRFALLLFGAIVAGNLFALWLGGSYTVSGGLSGGIYGLMGAEIVLIASLSGAQSLFTNVSFLSVLIINLAMNFIPGICWQAHLGGFTFGILCMQAFFRF